MSAGVGGRSEATTLCNLFSTSTYRPPHTTPLLPSPLTSLPPISMSINCTSPVFSCCFKGKHELVTSHSDGTIRSVDIKTGKTTSVIQAHNDECRSLDVTPCRRFMLSGGFDGTAGVFGLDESQKNDQPEFKAKVRHKGGGRVLSAKWRPRGDVGLLLSGADCSVQFWGRKEAVGVGAGVAK